MNKDLFSEGKKKSQSEYPSKFEKDLKWMGCESRADVWELGQMFLGLYSSSFSYEMGESKFTSPNIFFYVKWGNNDNSQAVVKH